MTLDAYLEAERGRAAALARSLGKSPGWVSKLRGGMKPDVLTAFAIQRLTGVPVNSWASDLEVDAYLAAVTPKKSPNVASCDAATETGAGNPVPQSQGAPGRSDHPPPHDQTGTSDAQDAGQVAL